MTQPSRPRPPRRPNAEYRWTRPKILAFLRALSLGGSVAAAAREVGMSRQSAYLLRSRLGDGFAEVWDEGVRLGLTARRAGRLAGAQGDSRAPQGDTF
jgi:hypothetical protein